MIRSLTALGTADHIGVPIGKIRELGRNHVMTALILRTVHRANREADDEN